MIVRSKSSVYFLLLAGLLMFPSHGWAQQTATGTKSVEKTTGAITGRVINSAGEPLAGATVFANSFGAALRSRSVSADNNGDFKIDGLEPGLYRLFALMAGYVSASQPGQPDPPLYRIGDSVTLSMFKGAVITGTVTNQNGPVVGVGVFVTRLKDEEGKKVAAAPSSRERSTDDRGVFRLYGLLPGTYVLWAARPRLGLVAPSPYDNDTPTYFPSATRDTTSELVVHDGDEVTADIQYRAEPGHAISGKVAGVVESQAPLSPGATITLVDVQRRTPMGIAGTFSTQNLSFAMYGVPDGEYELSASQYLPTRDELRSPPRRVTVRGADVTGLALTLAPLASIEGRLILENDPRAGCAKRKETAAQETLVYARRYEPEKKAADPKVDSPEVSISSLTFSTFTGGDEKGSFLLRNLPAGLYRIDPRAPAGGWYVKSIAIGPAPSAAAKSANPTTARDGISLKNGERITGLLITISEGASRVRGRISIAEGQTLPQAMVVYLVPAEREAVDNVLRFYESRPDADGSFTLANVAPGKYWIAARRAEENESGTAKSIRQDAALRAKVLKEAEALKKAVALKPCEQVADFELPYFASTSQP